MKFQRSCWDAYRWGHENIPLLLGCWAFQQLLLDMPRVYYRSSRSGFDLLLPLMSCTEPTVTSLSLISSEQGVAVLSLSMAVTELPSEDPGVFSNNCGGGPGSCLPWRISFFFFLLNPLLCLLPVHLAENTSISKQLRWEVDSILQLLGKQWF